MSKSLKCYNCAVRLAKANSFVPERIEVVVALRSLVPQTPRFFIGTVREGFRPVLSRGFVPRLGSLRRPLHGIVDGCQTGSSLQ